MNFLTILSQLLIIIYFIMLIKNLIKKQKQESNQIVKVNLSDIYNKLDDILLALHSANDYLDNFDDEITRKREEE